MLECRLMKKWVFEFLFTRTTFELYGTKFSINTEWHYIVKVIVSSTINQWWAIELKFEAVGCLKALKISSISLNLETRYFSVIRHMPDTFCTMSKPHLCTWFMWYESYHMVDMTLIDFSNCSLKFIEIIYRLNHIWYM